jgi:hypothetical protein
MKSEFKVCGGEVSLELHQLYVPDWDIQGPFLGRSDAELSRTFLLHHVFLHTPQAPERNAIGGNYIGEKIYSKHFPFVQNLVKKGVTFLWRQAFTLKPGHRDRYTRVPEISVFNHFIKKHYEEGGLSVWNPMKVIDADPFQFTDTKHLNADFNLALARILMTSFSSY